ncbi:hypothetical protein C0995_010870 [Termitomyces sp. Mi166|nr:hypothetical protein C0995_010870 [Termitomyces sp. Mi166\
MKSEAEGMRLLALDGGGIRGISELLILEEIMMRIKAEEGLEKVPKPCEYFDIIGGTGTGGLIAILLGRLCVSIEEATKAYIEFAGKVFSETKHMWQDGTFKASTLEGAVKDLVARYDESGDENARMMSDVSKKRECKTFVCAMSALNMSHPHLFRSYEVRSNQEYNAKIWEAVRATSAAPTFFKRIEIGTDPKEEFVDGGLRCNNPTAEVLREAQKICGMDYPMSCIVSIGTGHPKTITLRKPDRFQRLLPTDLIRVLIGISTDCENLSDEFERTFNVQQGLQDVSLAEWMKMGEVKAHTLQYLRGAAIGVEIDRVRDLLRRRSKNSHERQAQRIEEIISSGGRAEVPQKTLLVKKQEKVMASLRFIFDKVEHYKRLLSCGEDDAQKVLDAFQTVNTMLSRPNEDVGVLNQCFLSQKLLDTECVQDRGQLIAAMRRICERTNLYPTRFFLKGDPPSFGDGPVSAGSFADIYKIVFRGEETCFKVIRLYQRSQVEHMTKLDIKVYAREAILWAQLSHPNILPFYGLVEHGSRLSFVSRWATNGNLEDYLAHTPGANRLLLLNVLIDSSGRAALGDFGLSSVTDPQILKWSTQSTMASKGGTARWQAPELLASEDTYEKVHNSKASDVFAWASVCYEIFTGRLPYYEISKPTSVMLSILRGDTPTRPHDGDPAWLEHGLNDCIWELMENCWNFKPSERPDMTTVILRLDPQRPLDSRPTGEWIGKVAMHFRNAQDAELSKEMLLFWEELDSLISRIVPEI